MWFKTPAVALFRRIVDERGIAVLIATHDWIVAEYATAVYDLHDGRIAAVAPPV